MYFLPHYRQGQTEFGTRVEAITDDQWDGPTPDTEWSVKDLVDHLVTEQLWIPDLVAGQTIAEIGDRFEGDNLGDDPLTAWRAAAVSARAAWEEPGATERMVDLSFGSVPADEYGWQLTTDLAVHSWDLARAIGAPDQLDDDLVGACLTYVRSRIDVFQTTSLFAPSLEVPVGADNQTTLLALLGRDRHWIA